MICIHIVYIYIYIQIHVTRCFGTTFIPKAKRRFSFDSYYSSTKLQCEKQREFGLAAGSWNFNIDLRWKNIVVPAKIVCDIAVFMERVNSGNQVLVVCLIASDSAS